MLVDWPNLLLHNVLGVMLGWVLLEIWQQWRAMRRFEQLLLDQAPQGHDADHLAFDS